MKIKNLSLALFAASAIGSAMLPVHQAWADQAATISTSGTPTVHFDQAGSIGDWASKALIDAMSYNYLNASKHFAGSDDHFTQEGWASFKEAQRSSGNLDAVVRGKMSIKATATGAARLLTEQKELFGRVRYDFEIPMMESIYAPGAKADTAYSTDVSVILNKDGSLRISQVVANVAP